MGKILKIKRLLEKFFDCFLDFGNGVVHRAKSSCGLTLFVYDKLCKIPFYGIGQGSTLFLFEIIPQRMSRLSIDINFAEEVKSFVKLYSFVGSKFFDFGISPWLLGTELVARESQNA